MKTSASPNLPLSGKNLTMSPSAPLPIAVRIKTAVRMTGIGRSKLYELIASGDIESAKVGSSRLVIVASLQRLIAASRC